MLKVGDKVRHINGNEIMTVKRLWDGITTCSIKPRQSKGLNSFTIDIQICKTENLIKLS